MTPHTHPPAPSAAERLERIRRMEYGAGMAAQDVQFLLGLLEDSRRAIGYVFRLMDDQWLVRNTDHDHEPDWSLKQIGPVRRLAEVKALYDTLGGPNHGG